MRLRFWRRPRRHDFSADPSVAQVVDGLMRKSRQHHMAEPIRSLLTVMAEEHAHTAKLALRRAGEVHRLTGELVAAKRTLANTRQENDELKTALVRLDRRAEIVIESSVTGDHGLLEAVVYDLDETRGAIWARYDAASRALKDAL